MGQKAIALFAITSIILLTSFTYEVFAIKESDNFESKIVTDGDLYIESDIPTKVLFNVTAIDDSNNIIPVECDKISNSIFNVGKTKVRCMAIDPKGNQLRDSFVVTVGYNIVQIPDWFKQTTEFWVTQNMSDDEYMQTLKFLLEEQVMFVPQTKLPKDNTDVTIPIWINNIAKKWTEDKITNDEFSIGIKWMLDNNLIRQNKLK